MQDARYGPGDILTLMPSQKEDAVNAFLQRLSLDGAAYVTVSEWLIFSQTMIDPFL